MSSSDNRIYDDEFVARYLLGSLTGEETERLDELSITDDELAGRLAAIEHDLVDAYVRGELSGEELTRFKSHYLASSKRLDKVECAEAFLAFWDKSVPVQSEDTRSTTPAGPAARETLLRPATRSRFFPLPRLAPQWVLAAAALLLLIVGGAYLAVDNLRLRDQIAQSRVELEQREQALQRQLEGQKSSDAETERELASVRERLAQLQRDVGGSQQKETPATAQQRDLNVLAFSLTPQTRDASQIARLDVPAGTDYVALTLALEADDFPAYRATLKNPATGQIIWRSGRLKASDQHKTVRVSPRANLLNPQNYVLELYGISTTSTGDLVGSYPFRVVRQ